MTNKFFKAILYTYPPILMWMPEGTVVNELWGMSFIALFLLKLLSAKKLKPNSYFRFALLFAGMISISMLINWSFAGYNLSIAAKYLAPLFAAAYAYQFIESDYLKRLFAFYFWFFMGIWFIRFAQSGFPFLQIMELREEIWWGKPVVFGFLLTGFYFAYCMSSESVVNKKKVFKYLFALPSFFIGSRSSMIAIGIILIIFILSDLHISHRKIKRGFFFIFFSSLFLTGFIFNKIKDNPILEEALGSSRDVRSDNVDVSIDSFSSGRTLIWDAYINRISFGQIIFGFGGIHPDIGYVLHNDVLEMFFFYGIFTLIIFLYFLWQVYLKNALHSKDIFVFCLYIFVQIQLLFNPFTSSMSCVFFLLIVVWNDLNKSPYGKRID